MKLVIVVPDGMCDWRYPVLDNLSPVEYANTPGIDKIIRRGKVGMVRTMYDDLPLGSLVGLLGLLGYDPRQFFPLGRSIFEAHALGLKLESSDVAFRCNIVRVSNDGRLLDFTAGQIDETSAAGYLAKVTLPPSFEIHHDLSYRNVLIYRGCPLSVTDLHLHEPHENMGNPIEAIMPRYRNELFEPLIEIMFASQRDNLMLWPWGPSRARTFPQLPFKMCMVTALSFLYGMADRLGAQAVIPPGTTGYLDSDLGAKFTALVQNLSGVDIGVVHCNAPDEESHVNNLEGKIQAIEDIDRLVVSPLLDYFDARGEPYRILICPDHYTCCSDGKHHSDPVAYTVAGQGITPNHSLSTYSEVAIAEKINEVLESYQLIPTLLE